MLTYSSDTRPTARPATYTSPRPVSVTHEPSPAWMASTACSSFAVAFSRMSNSRNSSTPADAPFRNVRRVGDRFLARPTGSPIRIVAPATKPSRIVCHSLT